MSRAFMQKQAVIATLSDRTNMSRDQIEAVLTAYADLIAEELVAKGGINLPNLGRAKVGTRAAVAERLSVNPRTREPMTIPAVPERKVYRARFGKDFLARVQSKAKTE